VKGRRLSGSTARPIPTAASISWLSSNLVVMPGPAEPASTFWPRSATVLAAAQLREKVPCPARD